MGKDRILVDTGYSGRLYDLPVGRRVLAVIVPGCGLRDKDRKERHSRHNGRVHIVIDKLEVLRQETADHRVFRIGDIQFHLGIDIAAVQPPPLWIVPGLGLIDFLEDRAHVAVVRFHECRVKFVDNRSEGKVDLIESMQVHLHHLFLITQDGSGQKRQCVSCFQEIIAVQIRRHADSGIFEIHPGERNTFAGGRINDTPLHLCGLSIGVSKGKNRQNDGYR